MLVFDDLHAVAGPSCLDVISALLDYVPAGSQIAIASREAPVLPVARLRAHGRVEEIGVADLRLDEREAGLLFDAAGVEFDAADVSALTERTEGWPAGLYLAALAVQAGAPSAVAAAGFTVRTDSCRSTSASSSCRGCRRPKRSSSSTPRSWIG